MALNSVEFLFITGSLVGQSGFGVVANLDGGVSKQSVVLFFQQSDGLKVKKFFDGVHSKKPINCLYDRAVKTLKDCRSRKKWKRRSYVEVVFGLPVQKSFIFSKNLFYVAKAVSFKNS